MSAAQYQFNFNGSSNTGTLTWNSNGSLGSLAISDALNSSNTQNCGYAHDDLSRIASVSCGSTWGQTFSFDPFGNISKSGSISFAGLYDTSTNRLTNMGKSYDSNGNLTGISSDATYSYSWDSEGKPVSITRSGSTVNLTYDALGRMVEQNRGGSYTQIVYGPGGSKLALMNGSTLQKAFAPLPAGTQAVYNGSGLAYYRHADWLGSSRLASTPSRTLYYDGAYAPYGESYSETGTTDRDFTGQNQDTHSGLYDFMYREYHPVSGRWSSPDPAGLAVVDPSNPQS
jgi:RHS repeat-associated protein